MTPAVTLVRPGSSDIQPEGISRSISDGVVLGDSASGILSSSDEPLYAGVNLIFAGDASQSYYANLTAMGAAPLGSDIRLVPAPSPVSPEGSSPVDSTTCGVTTGKDGSGKAFQLKYPPPTYQTGGKMWLTNIAAAIAASKTVYVRCQKRLTGSVNSIFRYKHFHIYLDGVGGGAQPQWSTAYYQGPGSLPGPGDSTTVYQYWESAYQDSNNQGDQPFGPYFADLFDSAWHRFTFAYKSHASSGNKNGFARMWIDGKKVIDVSQAAVDVTPSGGGKPWCTQGQVDAMHINTAYLDAGSLAFWGGTCTTTNSPELGEDINIGDGDPTNLDTLAVWTD